MNKIPWADFIKTIAYQDMQRNLQIAGYHLVVEVGEDDKTQAVYIVKLAYGTHLGSPMDTKPVQT